MYAYVSTQNFCRVLIFSGQGLRLRTDDPESTHLSWQCVTSHICTSHVAREGVMAHTYCIHHGNVMTQSQHICMSHVACQGVMRHTQRHTQGHTPVHLTRTPWHSASSHVKESWHVHTAHITATHHDTGHVKDLYESRFTWRSHGTHIRGDTCTHHGNTMTQSHVTCLYESRRTWRSHGTYILHTSLQHHDTESRHTFVRVTSHMTESWHILTPRHCNSTTQSHVTHEYKSRHTWWSHGTCIGGDTCTHHGNAATTCLKTLMVTIFKSQRHSQCTYKVAKTHRMPQVAGHFPQESH